MGHIRIGTASWTDKTLLASGWYPDDAKSAEERLAFYASQFPIVEVDSTYYTPPNERNSELWAERTPPGFTFNIKAYSLLTQHPTRVASIYKDLRPESTKTNVYAKDLDPKVVDQVWDRFLAALDPLHQAGKLGALLFQFPQWFPIGRPQQGVHPGVQAARRPGADLRRVPQQDLDVRREPGRDARLPHVVRGAVRLRRHAAGPPVARSRRWWRRPPTWPWSASTATATSGPARTSTTASATTTPTTSWRTGRPRSAARRTRRETHVLLNNCYSDYAQTNAKALIDLLTADSDRDPA